MFDEVELLPVTESPETVAVMTCWGPPSSVVRSVMFSSESSVVPSPITMLPPAGIDGRVSV